MFKNCVNALTNAYVSLRLRNHRVSLVSGIARLARTRRWLGTASELLDAIGETVAPSDLPPTPSHLSYHLRLPTPQIELAGVRVTFSRGGYKGRKMIHLAPAGQETR